MVIKEKTEIVENKSQNNKGGREALRSTSVNDENYKGKNKSPNNKDDKPTETNEILKEVVK